MNEHTTIIGLDAHKVFPNGDAAGLLTVVHTPTEDEEASPSIAPRR